VKAAEPKGQQPMTNELTAAIHFAEALLHLIESQKTSYLGKVNFNYVRSLSKQRAQIINDALDTIIKNVPLSKHPSVHGVITTIETFFLTDHCVDASFTTQPTTLDIRRLLPIHLPSFPTIRTKIDTTGKGSPPALSSPVVPRSQVERRTIQVRVLEETEMENTQMVMRNDDKPILPNYASPVPTLAFYGSSVVGDLLEHNPYVFLGIFTASVAMLKVASQTTVTVDTDIFLLVCFSFFCIGLHFPRPAQPGIEIPFKTQRAKPKRQASAVIKRSMMVRNVATVNSEGQTILEVTHERLHDGDDGPLIVSPMPRYPEEAELGEYLNRWSAPNHEEFKVRGNNYLKDKKKVSSGEFLFPARGLDLFLTDACPENVGRNSGIMGGHFRDVPSFIVNFRLPWGVLLFYFEIPERFIPWIRKGHANDFNPDKENLPSLDSMSAGDRTLCRFLSGSQKHKDDVWKIVPVVVEGPWIVKQAVGGKPAIVGTKLPVTYIYQPAEGDKAMYFEADLDIVASSAARGILSVVRSYTQSLTLDLGFVIQGVQQDELPEQMMVGCRLHGLDPFHAPALPPMSNSIIEATEDYGGNEELTASASLT
jgi:Protein ENHANCED DISEASE RESISTANCE 2, C-terminal